MTTSGVTTYNPDVSEIIEDASSVAGAELRTGYDYRMTRMALNSLLASWGNRGLNLWTVQAGSLALTEGTATYNLDANMIDILDLSIRQNSGNTATQVDTAIQRISFSTYNTQPNKLLQAQPSQWMVQRLIQPTITFWPVPGPAGPYTAIYYYLRRMENAGAPDNTLDLPVRAIPALIAGLAYEIAMRKPGLEQRVPFLKQNAEEAYNLMASEDRLRTTTRWVPYRSYIGS